MGNPMEEAETKTKHESPAPRARAQAPLPAGRQAGARRKATSRTQATEAVSQRATGGCASHAPASAAASQASAEKDGRRHPRTQAAIASGTNTATCTVM